MEDFSLRRSRFPIEGIPGKYTFQSGAPSNFFRTTYEVIDDIPRQCEFLKCTSEHALLDEKTYVYVCIEEHCAAHYFVLDGNKIALNSWKQNQCR